LHTEFRSKPATRVDIPLSITVIPRIRINDTSDGPMLLSQSRFEAPPAVTVPRDDDLAFHIDAESFQVVVVVRHSVIHINEICGDVAIGAVSGVRR
jgi:hypothetical protein